MGVRACCGMILLLMLSGCVYIDRTSPSPPPTIYYAPGPPPAYQPPPAPNGAYRSDAGPIPLNPAPPLR